MKEGTARFLASDVGSEHADELPVPANKQPMDQTAPEDCGTETSESKRTVDVDVPIELMDPISSEISAADESMDLVEKDLAESKKRRPLDVVGGQIRFDY